MTHHPEDLPYVWLRAMEPEDLELLYTIENDTQLWCVGTANVPYSRFALRQFIEQQTGDIYTDKQVRLIAENTEGEVVGMADLIGFSPAHMRAEVGIIILSRHQGKGYATAALCQLEHYARTFLRLHQLYAIVAKTNSSSERLFSRRGFSVSGTLSHWLCLADGFHDALLMQKILDE